MSLLALADVKPHLQIDDNTSDTVLQAKLDAAEAFVSQATNGTGALAVTSVSQRAPGGSAALVLTNRPVVSVTSVTGVFSGALSLSDLDVNLEAGLIGYIPGLFAPFWDPYYTVVYTSGYATAAALSQDLIEAVRLMTQSFYETQRGPRRNVAGDIAPDAYTRAQRILEQVTTGSFA